MKIEINSIQNRGDQRNEFVALSVLEDCDLSNYILCDSTFRNHNGLESNIFPHTIWFKSRPVKKGESVIIYTMNKGTPDIRVSGSPTYSIYWGSDAPIWNNTGDTAILFEVADKDIKQVE